MIKNSVIVTALFDIGRDRWKDYQQSYGTYLYWMNNILNIDSHFIIFTEEKFVETILQSRRTIDPSLEKTKIVVEKFENLKSYKKYFNKIKNIMDSEDFQKKIHFRVPEMINPEYNTVIFNKFYFIEQAKKEMDYDLYIWCDAGLLRNDEFKNQKFPNIEKVNNGFSDKITFFSHDTEFSIHNREMHLLSQYRYIHGGCFFVPKKSNLNFLIESFENLIENFLKNGYVGSEEKYYDFCYEDNKDTFNIVKADWRQYFSIFQ